MKITEFRHQMEAFVSSLLNIFIIMTCIHYNYLWMAYTPVSIVGWVVIAILCLGEFRNYMRPVIKEHMTVDKTFGQQLQININISFHALTCAQVHVDAMDIAG